MLLCNISKVIMLCQYVYHKGRTFWTLVRVRGLPDGESGENAEKRAAVRRGTVERGSVKKCGFKRKMLKAAADADFLSKLRFGSD
jgi:hypothetical protein